MQGKELFDELVKFGEEMRTWSPERKAAWKKAIEDKRGPYPGLVGENEIAQAPPAQENQETKEALAGGCPAAHCSLDGAAFLEQANDLALVETEYWNSVASENSRNLEEWLGNKAPISKISTDFTKFEKSLNTSTEKVYTF